MIEFLMLWQIMVKQPVYSEIFNAQISCYNAEVGQTDNDPMTMANGKQVFDGAIANNHYKFGTKIEIKDKVYIVSDRMNRKYVKDNFDIFMWDKTECLKFGRQKLLIKVIK